MEHSHVNARYSRRGSAIAVVGIALVVTAACRDAMDEDATEPAPLSPELALYLTDSAPIVAGLDTSDADGLLTWVRHGRILPDQRGIILADETDRFLRVFDRTGRLITTALPRGEGPKEAKSVSGLAVSGSVDVLALTGLTGTGLKEYSLEGDGLRFLRSQPSPSDIPMFIVASRCDNGWAAYTTRQLRTPATIPVLAVSDRDSSGGLVWRNAASSVTQTRNFNWGSLLRMTSDER